MNIATMLATYADSYFKARDFVPASRIASPREQRRALAEYKADPQAVLKENVEQAREDVLETASRMNRAEADGLLDRDMYRAATPEEKTRWRAAVKLLKGDYQRAAAELAHWRMYLGEAIDGTLPMPGDSMRDLARRLADAKSYEDSRLPPERDDELAAGASQSGHVKAPAFYLEPAEGKEPVL